MLYEITNSDTGMRSTVNLHQKGYCVALQDMDSGEWVPTYRIFNNVESARVYAHKIVGVI